jgi:hypothetical protein
MINLRQPIEKLVEGVRDGSFSAAELVSSALSSNRD